MKKNMSKLLIIVVAIISISVFFSSCYDDNGDAVVTIHLERNDLSAMGIQYKEGVIDKILNFFSTRAEAGGAVWDASRIDLTVVIESESFDTKVFTIPPSSTTFSTTLPSGNLTTITITSTTDWDPMFGPIIQKNWGGQYTDTLTPGEQDITIKMIPMTFFNFISKSASVSVNWFASSVSGASTVTAYKLYRSTSLEGNYTLVGTITSPTVFFNDTTTGSTKYYYRVSCISSFGEGVMSDPSTWP